MKFTEADIFISHAVDDKELVEKIIDFLQMGLDIPGKRFFCSSSAGLGPGEGEGFFGGDQEPNKKSITGYFCR